MSEKPPKKLTVRCGQTITVPEGTPLPVEVEATPDTQQGVRVTQSRPRRSYRPTMSPYRPTMNPMELHLVSPAVEVEETKSFEEALAEAMERIGLPSFPPGSTLVVEADPGSLEPEQISTLTEAAQGLASSSQGETGPGIDVEVRLFSSGSETSP